MALLLVLIGAINAATVWLIVGAANSLKTSDTFRPEIVLPLLVVAGVISLLASLAIVAAAFGLFNMADKSQALGLPSGSVQAVIALSLILIFAVVALYARTDSGTRTFASTGLTRAQYKAIPQAEIVETDRTVARGQVSYDVVRSLEDSAAKDINTQLLTTVSTLVVAVAGFYFGSRSVQEGSKAALDAAGPTRSLAVIHPNSPQTLTDRSQPVKDIQLQSVPPEAQVRWAIDGDSKGTLARLQNGEFVYTPGEDAKSATLRFEQVDDPKVSDSLVVNLPDETESQQQALPVDLDA